MSSSARRTFIHFKAIFVITLFLIYLKWKLTQKEWQLNFTKKSDELINQENFTRQNNASQQEKKNAKFYIAFRYFEQLSMATNNLIALTALASYSGHQVVVPFVNNSKFFGYKMSSDDTQTLALYYNLSAFNNKLRSHGYSTLVSWERFQNVC